MLVNGGEEIQRYWKFEQRFLFLSVKQCFRSGRVLALALLRTCSFCSSGFLSLRFVSSSRLSSSGGRGCSASFTAFVCRLIITKETQSGTPEARGGIYRMELECAQHAVIQHFSGFCLVSQVPCRFQGPVNLNKPWAPSRQGQLEALGLEGEVEALGWKCRGAHERNFQAE